MLRLLTTCTLILFSTLSLAQGTFARNLNIKLDKTKTLEADFVQIQRKNNKVVQYTGSVLIEKPNKFRWSIKQPDKQEIIADGKRLWVYDVDLEQVTVESIKQRIGEVPALLLSQDNSNIEQDFNVEYVEPEYILTPKDKDSLINNIAMVFDGPKIKKMTLTDGMGQITELEFSNVNINIELPTDMFGFKVPPGVDVIGDPDKVVN